MALTYTNFTCFADVEAWYNGIKPVRGPKHAGQDVRPIGDRTRKYERIVKIDDDCYALSDGYHRGDAVFPSGSDAYDPTLADMEAFAPIVWRRYGQGIERVTLRNGIGPRYTHSGRYTFLARHKPVGLTFVQTTQGRQFIKVNRTGTDIFLAKGTHVHPTEYAEVVAQRDRGSRNVWHTLPWCTGTVDTTSLVFQRDGSGWEFISHNGVVPPVPRNLVDKDTKAKYRDDIKAFCDWALTVTPMIDVGNFQVRLEYDTQFTEWAKDNPQAMVRHWGRVSTRLPAPIAREVITNPEHPLRIFMAVFMAYETGVYGDPIRDQSDLTYVRSKVNRWINKVLGFNVKG
jgi:hypothetical protein